MFRTLVTARSSRSGIPGDRQVAFANHPKVGAIATRGPLTPDHVIRTKRIPLIIGKNPQKNIERLHERIWSIFQTPRGRRIKTLWTPRHVGRFGRVMGTIAFGTTLDEANIINDITEHTIDAILVAEKLGGWQALPEKDIFESRILGTGTSQAQ